MEASVISLHDGEHEEDLKSFCLFDQGKISHHLLKRPFLTEGIMGLSIRPIQRNLYFLQFGESGELLNNFLTKKESVGDDALTLRFRVSDPSSLKGK